MAYVPSAGSVAAKAIEYLRGKGEGATARSKEIGEAIGIAPNLIAGSMQDAVRAGLVISCSVTGVRGGRQNEYRIGAGVPDTFEPLKPSSSPHWRGDRARDFLFSAKKPAVKAPAEPEPEPDTAPSECLPPERMETVGLAEADAHPAVAEDAPTFWFSNSGTFRIEAGFDTVSISTEDAARFVAFYYWQVEGT